MTPCRALALPLLLALVAGVAPAARADDGSTPHDPLLTLSSQAILFESGNRHFTGSLLNRDGTAIPDVAVSLTITQSGLTPTSVQTVTGPDGGFSYAFHMTRKTRVYAHLDDDQGNPIVGLTQTYTTPLIARCTANPRRVAIRQTIAISCPLPAVPHGTPVKAQYYYAGTWYSIAKGPSPRGRLTATVSFGRSGTYPLRMVIHDNVVYAQTFLRPPTVTVT